MAMVTLARQPFYNNITLLGVSARIYENDPLHVFSRDSITLVLDAAPPIYQRPRYGNLLAGDALIPPPHAANNCQVLTAASVPHATNQAPFLAGRVAVQAIFVESNGAKEPSTSDWTPAQMAEIQKQLAKALDWWHAAPATNARPKLRPDQPGCVIRLRANRPRPQYRSEWAGDTLHAYGRERQQLF